MYQAIETKYLGPTDHRGSRVRAKCQAGSVTLSWDHALDTVANHAAAARALIRKLGWDNRDWYALVRRTENNPAAYVFVQADPLSRLEL